ncbi:MAG TPA: hypothetical protein VGE12_06860 [Noviherbaspirillum sp.]
MLRFFKTLLLALLMLALPIQGLAAATAVSCGTAHQHNTLAALNASGHDNHVHPHQHGADGEHVMRMHLHSDEASAASLPHGVSAPDQHVSASTCSACAACCMGAGIPSSATPLQLSDQGALAPAAATVSTFAGHIPDGLKRPPRPLLA